MLLDSVQLAKCEIDLMSLCVVSISQQGQVGAKFLLLSKTELEIFSFAKV